MSATHKRLLPEPDRIPYFRNPSNPATSVCAAGLPTDRGELPVFVSFSAPPVLTSEDGTCGASPRVRGRTLPPIDAPMDCQERIVSEGALRTPPERRSA